MAIEPARLILGPAVIDGPLPFGGIGYPDARTISEAREDGPATACPCGHGPGDFCMNTLIHGPRWHEHQERNVLAAAGQCKALPGCCDPHGPES